MSDFDDTTPPDGGRRRPIAPEHVAEELRVLQVQLRDRMNSGARTMTELKARDEELDRKIEGLKPKPWKIVSAVLGLVGLLVTGAFLFGRAVDRDEYQSGRAATEAEISTVRDNLSSIRLDLSNFKGELSVIHVRIEDIADKVKAPRSEP